MLQSNTRSALIPYRRWQDDLPPAQSTLRFSPAFLQNVCLRALLQAPPILEHVAVVECQAILLDLPVEAEVVPLVAEIGINEVAAINKDVKVLSLVYLVSWAITASSAWQTAIRVSVFLRFCIAALLYFCVVHFVHARLHCCASAIPWLLQFCMSTTLGVCISAFLYVCQLSGKISLGGTSRRPNKIHQGGTRRRPDRKARADKRGARTQSSTADNDNTGYARTATTRSDNAEFQRNE